MFHIMAGQLLCRESETWLPGAWPGNEGRHCVTAGEMEKFQDEAGGDGCTMSVYSLPVKRIPTLKNGWNGKAHVLTILPQWKETINGRLNTGMWKAAFSSSAQFTAEGEIKRQQNSLQTSLGTGLKAGKPSSGHSKCPSCAKRVTVKIQLHHKDKFQSTFLYCVYSICGSGHEISSKWYTTGTSRLRLLLKITVMQEWKDADNRSS